MPSTTERGRMSKPSSAVKLLPRAVLWYLTRKALGQLRVVDTQHPPPTAASEPTGSGECRSEIMASNIDCEPDKRLAGGTI